MKIKLDGEFTKLEKEEMRNKNEEYIDKSGMRIDVLSWLKLFKKKEKEPTDNVSFSDKRRKDKAENRKKIAVYGIIGLTVGSMLLGIGMQIWQSTQLTSNRAVETEAVDSTTVNAMQAMLSAYERSSQSADETVDTINTAESSTQSTTTESTTEVSTENADLNRANDTIEALQEANRELVNENNTLRQRYDELAREIESLRQAAQQQVTETTTQGGRLVLPRN